jgi:hypothetical protein
MCWVDLCAKKIAPAVETARKPEETFKLGTPKTALTARKEASRMRPNFALDCSNAKEFDFQEFNTRGRHWRVHFTTRLDRSRDWCLVCVFGSRDSCIVCVPFDPPKRRVTQTRSTPRGPTFDDTRIGPEVAL